jgi:hypothetical protein
MGMDWPSTLIVSSLAINFMLPKLDRLSCSILVDAGGARQRKNLDHTDFLIL